MLHFLHDPVAICVLGIGGTASFFVQCSLDLSWETESTLACGCLCTRWRRLAAAASAVRPCICGGDGGGAGETF